MNCGCRLKDVHINCGTKWDSFMNETEIIVATLLEQQTGHGWGHWPGRVR